MSLAPGIKKGGFLVFWAPEAVGTPPSGLVRRLGLAEGGTASEAARQEGDGVGVGAFFWGGGGESGDGLSLSLASQRCPSSDVLTLLSVDWAFCFLKGRDSAATHFALTNPCQAPQITWQQ
jgi:hypothetical protein